MPAAARAVFFDVDFTLIYPGPMFSGEGYRAFCSRYGIQIDPERFPEAIAGSAPLLDGPETMYEAEIFIAYTRSIIELMGGAGPQVDPCAREIYDEWAACRHFELYEDVPAALSALAGRGVRIGLISNSHRCLTTFQSHFALEEVVSAAVSSAEHGFMKPAPSIFQTALQQVNVAPGDAVMVGDNIRQDVEGALAVGMRAVLLHRGDTAPRDVEALRARGVPVIRSLAELPALLFVS